MKLGNKILPSYTILPLISAFSYNCIIYGGVMRYVKIFFIMTLQRNWIEIYHLFQKQYYSIFSLFVLGYKLYFN